MAEIFVEKKVATAEASSINSVPAGLGLPAKATSTIWPFVNRKGEICELCSYSLRTIENCYAPQDQAQTQRKILVQGIGAGKKTLGANFLRELKQHPEYFDECKQQFPRIRDSAYTHLLNLQYVTVDLGKTSTLRGVLAALIKALLDFELAMGNFKGFEHHPNLRKHLNFCKEISYLSHVVLFFETEFKHCYFLHFDGLCNVAMENGARGADDAVSAIFQIQDHHSPRSLVYVTSCNLLPYLLWLGLFEKGFQENAASAELVGLDVLRPEHILEMLLTINNDDDKPNDDNSNNDKHHNTAPQDENRQAIAEAIFRRTAGVPRYVVHTLDLLAASSSSEWLALVTGGALIEHFAAHFPEDLYCWKQQLESPDEERSEKAAQLIRLTSQETPFTFTLRSNSPLPSGWGLFIETRLLGSEERWHFTPLPVALLGVFPLHLARVQEPSWKFVIPPMCLEVCPLPFKLLQEQSTRALFTQSSH